MAGSVFKKCGCREPVLGADGSVVLDRSGKPVLRRVGASCPRLRRRSGWSPSHGSWHFQLAVTVPGSGREVIARGGLATRPEAETQLSAVSSLLAIADSAGDDAAAAGELKVQIAARIRRDLADTGRLPDYDTLRRAVTAGQALSERTTVGQWLTGWLDGRAGLAPSTRRTYASHIEQYLIPHLGSIPLDRLRVHHVQEMIATIAREAETAEANNTARHGVEDAARAAWHDKDHDAWREARAKLAVMTAYRRPCNAATRALVRATLRSALSAAQSQQLVVVNVAALADIPAGRRPRARVWTPERVERWRATGEVPSAVMVWTPQQTAVFLARACRHRQRALFHLLAYTGLRRGEAVGLRWIDVDIASRRITVEQQTVELGWDTATTSTKTGAGDRDVPLGEAMVAELTEHRDRQQAEKTAAGDGWVDTGLVFTGPDGTGLHPAWVTDQFQHLSREAGLPPIRLHDLRHGAASLALAAGVDIKVVSEMLGHSGTAITRDTYTSVYTDLKRSAAEAIAAVLTQAQAATSTPDALPQIGLPASKRARGKTGSRSKTPPSGRKETRHSSGPSSSFRSSARES